MLYFTEKFFLTDAKLTGFSPPSPGDFSSLCKLSFSVGLGWLWICCAACNHALL